MNCKQILKSYLRTPRLLKQSVEELLLSLENALASRISAAKSRTHANLYLVFFIVIIFQYFIWKKFLNLEQDLSDFSNFGAKYFSLAPIATVIVILSYELFHYFKKDVFYCLVLANFATLAVFASLLEMAHFKYSATIIISFYVLTILVNLFIWLLTYRMNSSIRTSIFLLLGGSIAGIVAYFPNSSQLVPNLLLFHFYRFVFVFTNFDPKQVMPMQKSSLSRNLAFIFSPAYLTTPLPINYSQWKVSGPDEHIKLKSKAAIYLVICLVFLFFMKEVKPLRSLAQKGIEDSFWKWHAFGLANYVYFFLFSYVNITLPISLLWWCGIKLPDPYQLPLLAATPQDRWRRWNTYFYEWFFKFIYLPMYRRTASLAASIFVVFVVTFLLHASRYSDLWLLDVETYPSLRNMSRKYLFFMAHGILVYLGIKYSHLWPSENKPSGWIGVLVMLVVMSFIHGIFLLI